MRSFISERRKKRRKTRLSLSGIFTFAVAVAVMFTSTVTILFFVHIYRDAMEQNAVTTSAQAAVQVSNMVENYIGDMEGVMDKICEDVGNLGEGTSESVQSIVAVRKDIVAVTIYDTEGNLLNCWTNGKELKDKYYKNLSYMEPDKGDENALNISRPHVESLFRSYYPWVVTFTKQVKNAEGESYKVAMDIHFSNIANFVDDVGIGQHGYCYISDDEGNIIYHPQQQLIYSGLKKEEHIDNERDIQIRPNAIYTAHTLKNYNWRIVGICFVDEMITTKTQSMIMLLIFILIIVFFSTIFLGLAISRLFSKPARRLAVAMSEFERNAENFRYNLEGGTEEISVLSESFGHMVIRIQGLMEKVRREEVTLRKTELKALQAQINPHFLYNTLDAIAWLCEDERNVDAEEMVNALARLFRISISKGHELIPIEKEIQHAQSYLKIENFRYKNQFTYTFDVDKSCLHFLCNKITLQPIIENAIYHGLNRMVDEGRIKIKIWQEEADVLFSVEDNGVGMTEERCKEILYQENGDRTGIGIKNVNDRIKIYFGEEYGLSIQSEIDEGTSVKIRMPKVSEERYD